MTAPRAVEVIGFKNAGKTKVVEALVRELAHRHLKVGTIKHGLDDHELDSPGKDTWRHSKAGSVASAILTSKNAAIFINHHVDLIDAIAGLGSIDIIIIEGFKSLDFIPRMIVPRESGDIKKLSNGMEIAIAALTIAGQFPVDTSVPVIPLENIERLANLVEAKASPFTGRWELTEDDKEI